MDNLKSIFVLSCFAMLCVSAAALDFTGKDGKVYNNAMLMKVMPDGIVVSYVDSDGFSDVKYVRTAQLPVNIVKKYGLTPQTAAVMNAQVAPTHTEQTKTAKPTIPPASVPSGLASLLSGVHPNSSYLTPEQKNQFNKLDDMVKGLPDQGLLTGLINVNENHLNDINEQIHEIDDPSDIKPEDRN